MKNINLITLISLCVFIFSGCQSGTLSPDSADINNPAAVNELVDAASSDEAVWKDKKISATGYVGGKSTSGNKYTITIRNDKKSNFDKTVICVGEGSVPEDLMKKNDNWIFTGTVERVEKDKRVELKPCEIRSK